LLAFDIFIYLFDFISIFLYLYINYLILDCLYYV